MEWIKVEDGLPKDGDEVLCCGTYARNHGNVFHCCFLQEFRRDPQWLPFEVCNCETQCYNLHPIENVSHWMPLPKPPEVSKCDGS